MVKTIAYLLLVTFFTPTIHKVGQVDFGSINESPYDGVAIKITDPYSDQPISTLSEAEINKLRTIQPDIWPWVFFNRFCGYDTRKRLRADKELFRRIKGLDLFNEQGALSYFYSDWETALIVARDFDSPGVIVDPELYNDPSAYRVDFVSNKHGISDEKAIKILRSIGTLLADRANIVNPKAQILFLASWLAGRGREKSVLKNGYAPSVTYIIEGMLEQVRIKKYQLQIFAGGETSLNYCYKTIDDVKTHISNRQKAYTETLDKNKNLALAGVIAPWKNKNWRPKTGWRKKKRCYESDFQSAVDFTPAFQILLESYPLVWIYAAKGLEYNPFVQEKSVDVNSALEKTITTIKGTG